MVNNMAQTTNEGEAYMVLKRYPITMYVTMDYFLSEEFDEKYLAGHGGGLVERVTGRFWTYLSSSEDAFHFGLELNS